MAAMQCLVLQAYVAMRKGGKRLGVFDLNLEVKWEGSGEARENDCGEAEQAAQDKEGGKSPIEGTLSISEFAQESDEDDWMIDCSTTATGKHAVRPRPHVLLDLASCGIGLRNNVPGFYAGGMQEDCFVAVEKKHP